ncbi:MAG: YkvA family protein [Myxococcota bacterium]
MTRRRAIGFHPLRIWRALRNPKTPWGPKLLLLGALVYLIWPLDLVPDVPFIGFLDDLGIFMLALGWVSRVVDESSAPDAPGSEED